MLHTVRLSMNIWGNINADEQGAAIDRLANLIVLDFTDGDFDDATPLPMV